MSRFSVNFGRAALSPPARRWAWPTCGLLCLVLALCVAASPAQAATSRTEAERIPHAGTCWPQLKWNVLSAKGGRSCTTPNAPISWSTTVPSGEQGTVKVHGFRNTDARTIRLRVDRGAWVNTTVPGGATGVVLMTSTPVLAAGTHEIEMEFVSGLTVTFDYTELVTEPAPPPAPAPVVPPDPVACAIDPPDGQVAIAAAIGNCPDGSRVLFPAGRVYTQTDDILVADRSDLIIDGNGSTFRSTVPTSYDSPDPKPQWRVKSGRNVTLQNMVIVGNFYPTSRAKLAGNQLDHGVEIKGGDGITVQDSTFRNVFGDAVTTVRSESMRGNATGGVASRNVHVLRNTITTMARQCLSFTELLVGSIEDNTLSDCHYGGIDLEINFGGQKMQDIKVLRNTIHGYTLAAIAVEGAVSSAQVSAVGDIARIEVRGNTVGAGDTCWPPILLSEKDNERGPLSDITVANNIVSSPSYGIGVFDVIGGSVSGNDVTLTRSKTYCASTLTTVMPVWVKRSSGVIESGNITHGY